MSVPPHSLGRPVVVGANHRSSSLALRDALFVDDAAAPAFLERLRQGGLTQAMAVSTCDRVEVITWHIDPLVAAAVVTQALAERAGVSESALAGQLYTLVGPEAVRHCFAVASSLDSLVIGEPHVLGQVKACHRFAREAALVGPELDALIGAAFQTAKRVRSETQVAERPVSIAAAATQVARDLHGDIANCDALLVGAGDMGELVVEALQAAGLRRLVVTAPRASRAESLAASLQGHVVPFENLGEALAGADIVVCSVSGRNTVVGPEHIQAALKRRRRKPMFLVDAGIPGDVDPAVNRIDGAFLYDLTDLEKLAMEGRASREAAARDAWAIVESELAAWNKGRAERAAVPAIVSLRARAEALRAQALQDAAGDADRATQLLVQRLLHDPSEVMKEIAAGGQDWQTTEQVLKRLFRLE